jgi:hypothetical protein
LHPKPAALIQFRFHTNLAAHSLDGAPDDAQADACAGVVMRRVNTLEYLKYTLTVAFRNANSIVLDPDAGVGAVATCSKWVFALRNSTLAHRELDRFFIIRMRYAAKGR